MNKTLFVSIIRNPRTQQFCNRTKYIYIFIFWVLYLYFCLFTFVHVLDLTHVLQCSKNFNNTLLLWLSKKIFLYFYVEIYTSIEILNHLWICFFYHFLLYSLIPYLHNNPVTFFVYFYYFTNFYFTSFVKYPSITVSLCVPFDILVVTKLNAKKEISTLLFFDRRFLKKTSDLLKNGNFNTV